MNNNQKKTFHELVSKAYCINLYFRPERWNQASKEFAREGINVERFNAIDGKEFKTKYPMVPGNCGCNLSHYLIITAAMFQGLEAILVMEDDAVLRPGFIEKINQILQDLPEDWNILMLGGSHKIKPTKITDNILKVNRSFCSHAYIMRSDIFEEVLKRMKPFDQPLDCLFTEQIQKEYNVYITNPPMIWQRPGFSDIENRNMNYDFLQTNEQ